MPFIPHTEQEVKDMLAVIGAASVDQLFDEIPANLRVKDLPPIPPRCGRSYLGLRNYI